MIKVQVLLMEFRTNKKSEPKTKLRSWAENQPEPNRSKTSPINAEPNSLSYLGLIKVPIGKRKEPHWRSKW